MSNDAHSRPTGEAEELLYDASVATPSHGERARTLVASAKTATLCTIAREPEGHPYGSFVTFSMADGSPILFVSELAEHTKNLQGDSRASLLVAEGGEEDPLANGRVTLLGDCRRLGGGSERDAAKRSYLEAHPNASYYIDYSDFAFWRLEATSLRYIGGYGRMSWVSLEDWNSAEPDPIAPLAAGIIDHMNRDHGDALVAYCRTFSRAEDTSSATMTGVDRYGFEMSAVTERGPRPIRLAFSQQIRTSEDARRQMVELVRRTQETSQGRP